MNWTPQRKFSYILVNRLLANFQFYGFQTKIVDFLLTNAKPQKSTLLVKIWSDEPHIRNLPLIHLPIYKKIFVLMSKSKIFINKLDFVIARPQISTLLIKIFDLDPKTKIFLYIGKWINGKF